MTKNCFVSLAVIFLFFSSSSFVFSVTPSATYKINEVKNESGSVLSSVKIYVDDVYVHHYAPETLTFCEDCTCDTYVDCGFGDHTISLQKTGYQEWSESETINVGESYEVNPIMLVVMPTLTATPTLTPTPTSTPIPTIAGPTPTATVTPTLTARWKINEVKDSGGVVLNSVKIYLDGDYICHYPPEDLIFCDDCQHECDEVMIDYSFGGHEVRLEKTGYND